MREDAPPAHSMDRSQKALGICIPCNRNYAVFLPLPRTAWPFHLPIRSTIAIASPSVVSGPAWRRFAACHLAFIADADHQGGNAALSCRLCLIACNSRQIDELESGRD